MSGIQQHPEEVRLNHERWEQKPLLRKIYQNFYKTIASEIGPERSGLCVEIGSGLGNIKEVIPHCIRTDIFDQPWLDLVENAYQLSFGDRTVSDLILFDVFHHLRFPGTALSEFSRVLRPEGKIILFEPDVSMLGRLVYGAMHPEPLGLRDPITWHAPAEWRADDIDYYAAQGNAWRMFVKGLSDPTLQRWKVSKLQRFSALSYVASGGYSGPQLYPTSALPVMRKLDRLFDLMPAIFSTRLLVVLEQDQESTE